MKLNEVTWYSKLLAAVLLFGVLPALTYYAGLETAGIESNYAAVPIEVAWATNGKSVFPDFAAADAADTACARKTESQRDIDRCAADYLDTVRGEVAAVYAKLESLGAGGVDLEKARALWEQYIEQECLAVLGPSEEGGSIWPTYFSYCEAGLMRSHVEDLRNLYTPENGPRAGVAPF